MSGGFLQSIIRGFLQHRIAANLLAISVCLLGLLAVSRLNTQFFPTVQIPTIFVTVAWQGASPDDISTGVLDVMEPELRFIDRVDNISSYAVEGSARIVLEFEDSADMTKALSDVEQAVAGITTLPSAAESPVITRVEFFETVAMLAVYGDIAEQALQEVAREARDGFLNAGIDKITFVGKRPREVWVDADSRELRRLGLTSDDVARRIAAVNQNQPLGNLEGGAERTLRTLSRTDRPEGIGSIEIRAGPGGERVLVRDIAQVRSAMREGGVRLFRNGKPAILLDIQRAESADTLQSMNITRDYVETLRAGLPPNVTAELFDVRAEVVDQRIATLSSNALMGMAIIVLVLLLFLNTRVALWVAAGIPVALLATFVLMWTTGQTINAISLLGLILVLGILVDDAIIVGEHAVTLHEQGKSPMEAAEGAAMRMLVPVIAATTTTQAAFLPVFMISGVVGQIIMAIPLVVVVALAAALIESFIVLPTHLRHALTAQERARARPAGWWTRIRKGMERGLDRFRNGPVRRVATLAVHWRYSTLALVVGALILAVGLIAGGRVQFTFFPTPEAEFISAEIRFAPGISEEAMVAHLRTIENAIDDTDRAIEERHGERVVTFHYSKLGQAGQDRGSNLAMIDIELTPGEDRSVRTPQVIRYLREGVPRLPGLDEISISTRAAGPPGSDVDIRLTGADLLTLKAAAEDLKDRLADYPAASGIKDDTPFGKNELILRQTPRGMALGLDPEVIASQVRAAYQGVTAMRFAAGDEEVTIRVRQPDRIGDIAGLLDMTLRAPGGAMVRLGDVVAIEEREAFGLIQRRDGQVAVSVTADVNSDITPAGEVRASVEEDILPEIRERYGVQTQTGGQAETQGRAFADLGLGAIIALAAIYVILALVFQNWTQPILIMTIIPFGFIGAVLGHWLLGFQFAFLSMIGLLGLSGILVNGSIVLVDRYNERVRQGEAHESAAIGSSVDRFRAVLLTSLTTAGGMAPLIMEQSLQAQFLIPIAITLSFGLAVSALVILFVVPAMLGIADDFGRMKRGYLRLAGLRVRPSRP
ncbi:MAG: efflux RND transporter permease subunit [Salinarimonas sp.]|nr:efflux RND transporter permease subunit [Salinarimonas sp.]